VLRCRFGHVLTVRDLDDVRRLTTSASIGR
jgi:hypothetical protein